LARKLHEAKTRDLAHLYASAVEVKRIAQALFDGALVLVVLHVDEIDHDQAAEIAQAQLAGDLVGRLKVGAQGGFFDVGAPRGAGGVDVDGHQRLGVVDDDRTARRQLYGARVGGFDVVLDLEAREHRDVVAVYPDALDVVRHHHAHEGCGLFGDFVGIDQDLADFRREIVANGPDDQAGFEIDENGRGIVARGCVDGIPQLQQIGKVPLQFFDAAADAGRTGNDAHALRRIELLHGFAQLLPVFAFDPARYAAAAWIVGHEDQIAAGQRNESGERGTLVAALFFFDLDDEFLSLGQRVLDTRCAY